MTRVGAYAKMSPEKKEAYLAKKREKYRNDAEYRKKTQDANHRWRYGVTKDDKQKLLASQGGVCACCGGVDTTAHGWHTDHDHETGKVRGVLCHHCNVMLGQAGDSLDRLLEGIHYLMKHGKKF